ncbi:MAG TPA: Hsp20/alpha crystallin family protein [Cyclobacteriaceae bacterium]|jgi:HSP20 family protein|nr:Hsp20/alpha crystallin family protein [Cyclobacteriaceae bacterium]
MKTLVRQNATLFPSLPSLLEDFFNRDWADSTLANRNYSTTLPAVNVRETNDNFIIDVAAPGMKRDEFKVELDNNVLTISSQHEEKDEQQDETINYTRREFNYQSFQRSFTLPEDKVEGEKISARYLDGILNITVPKKDEAKVKPVKQITIG